MYILNVYFNVYIIVFFKMYIPCVNPFISTFDLLAT